jgi:hypothetical protein
MSNDREQYLACYNCGKPLSDNQLVKDGYKTHQDAAWAKGQLGIVADMLEHRGHQWFANKIRDIEEKIKLELKY